MCACSSVVAPWFPCVNAVVMLWNGVSYSKIVRGSVMNVRHCDRSSDNEEKTEGWDYIAHRRSLNGCGDFQRVRIGSVFLITRCTLFGNKCQTQWQTSSWNKRITSLQRSAVIRGQNGVDNAWAGAFPAFFWRACSWRKPPTRPVGCFGKTMAIQRWRMFNDLMVMF